MIIVCYVLIFYSLFLKTKNTALNVKKLQDPDNKIIKNSFIAQSFDDKIISDTTVHFRIIYIWFIRLKWEISQVVDSFMLSYLFVHCFLNTEVTWASVVSYTKRVCWVPMGCYYYLIRKKNFTNIYISLYSNWIKTIKVLNWANHTYIVSTFNSK